MDDAELRSLLQRTRRIAVLGIKADPSTDAHRVPRYLQERGMQIVPVNPKLDRVLGEAAIGSLAELREPVDLVNLFRAVAHVPAHTDEILALEVRPSTVWMQLGIRDEASARRLRQAGIEVVEDRCLMVEYARLLGGAELQSRVR